MSSPQLNLFPPTVRVAWKAEDDHAAWEARFLRELAEAPIVSPRDGMTGCRLEALVGRGHASREPAGFMQPPPNVERYAPLNPAARKEYIAGFRAVERELRDNPVQLYRYSITNTGRAAVEVEDA